MFDTELNKILDVQKAPFAIIKEIRKGSMNGSVPTIDELLSRANSF